MNVYGHELLLVASMKIFYNFTETSLASIVTRSLLEVNA